MSAHTTRAMAAARVWSRGATADWFGRVFQLVRIEGTAGQAGRGTLVVSIEEATP